MAANRTVQQVRQSAAVAFRSALQVILVIALTLPFQVLIGVFFDKKINTDWKLALKVGGTIASIWYLVTFTSTLVDFRKYDRINAARAPSFPATSFLTGLYGLTAIVSLALIKGLNAEGDPMWLQLLPLVFVGIAFYAWPRTIHCAELSVWQRDRWGRKTDIPYQSIQAISVSPGGTTTVLGSEVTIEHTPQHVDAESFRHFVSSRSAKPIY